ncbi:hypothetical protein Y032_0191g1279 [Ancylostoma ceylanicum]|nr:hypothetical protein Y032_0191g1279 [Ancylostoma ceylanicum]
MFMMALTQKVYRHIELLDQSKWEIQALRAQLQDHMCRIEHRSCLDQVNLEFQKFATQCANSRHGTAKCVGVAPDYRQSVYCYGLRQNPKSIELVESMRKYFAEKAIYFNRDGEKLLHAMSCINDTSKLNGYINLVISGELPETIIQYIGDNEVTGQLLFEHLNKNLKQRYSVALYWLFFALLLYPTGMFSSLLFSFKTLVDDGTLRRMRLSKTYHCFRTNKGYSLFEQMLLSLPGGCTVFSGEFDSWKFFPFYS